jgi:NADPH:quinone reductase-like Zn-dependent oxidoreductase
MTTRVIATDFCEPAELKFVDVVVPPPKEGEVTIEVRACGVNPCDYLIIAGLIIADPAILPIAVGYEVSGVISAIGPNTEIASGSGAVGDPVLAFCIEGGYSAEVTVPASDVFAMPASLSFPEAANLLLCGTTAKQMLEMTGATEGETILVHGASGATGVSVVQQARLMGVRVIGTCSPANFDLVRGFGGCPVQYGQGLEQRIRELAPHGVHATLDCVGTDEAIDTSFALVDDRSRIVTIAAFPRAFDEDILSIFAEIPGDYRNSVRADIVQLAADGKLKVPVARTFPLSSAVEALDLLMLKHPGGKFALVP